MNKLTVFFISCVLIQGLLTTSINCMDIFEAAEQGNDGRILELIAAGKDVDKKKWDMTPLHFAAKKGHATVMKTLIAAKANVNLKDENGKTPLHLTVTPILKVFIPDPATEANLKHFDHCAPISSEPVDHELQSIVPILIASGADVNVKDREGMTPLHLAAYHGYLKAVQTLISAGADINTRKRPCGGSPLYSAAGNGHKTVVQTLLRAGADATVICYNKWTPLSLATDNKHPEVVKIIKEHLAHKEILSLLGALHSRPGVNSPLNTVPQWIFRDIYELLKIVDR